MWARCYHMIMKVNLTKNMKNSITERTNTLNECMFESWLSTYNWILSLCLFKPWLELIDTIHKFESLFKLGLSFSTKNFISTFSFLSSISLNSFLSLSISHSRENSLASYSCKAGICFPIQLFLCTGSSDLQRCFLCFLYRILFTLRE